LRTIASLCLVASFALAGPVAAHAQVVSEVQMRSEAQRRFTKSGLIIRASITRDAAEQGDAAQMATYRELVVAREENARKERDLKQARSSLDTEHRKTARASARAEQAESELKRRADITAREEAFVAELARRNPGYAVAMQVFSDRMSKALQNPDPRISEALDRYVAGEPGALDDLSDLGEEIIAANREADAAAKTAINAAIDRQARKRDGDLRRSIAQAWTNGADKGDKTNEQALEKWLLAALGDPDDFDQWLQIRQLARFVENSREEERAADELWARANTAQQRAEAASACAAVHLAPGKWCNGEWTRDDYQHELLRLLRELVVEAPSDLVAQLNLADELANQADYKRGEDEDGRKLQLREAWKILDNLHVAVPDSYTIEIRRFEVGAQLGIGMSDPATLIRARALRESAVTRARAFQARFPASWVAGSALADALEKLSEVTDMQRDEPASLAATDEAVAIALRLSGHRSADMKRKSLLWSAHTRAGMSARVFAAFARERDHHSAAMEAGRGYERGHWAYMTELAGPRLQVAELASGNIAAARALNEINYGEGRAAIDEAGSAPVEPFLHDYYGATYDWIELKFEAAERRYREIARRLNKPDHYRGLIASNRLIVRTMVHLSLITIAIERERYPAALRQGAFFLDSLRQHEADRHLAPLARLVAEAVREVIVHIPGAPLTWADIELAALDDIDPKVLVTDRVPDEMLLARRRALEIQNPAAVQGQEPEKGKAGLLQALQKTFTISDQLVSELPLSAALISMILSTQKMRAHAGDPQVSWASLANDYVDFHKRGWLTIGVSIDEMHFALARAAVLKRRAEVAAAEPSRK
jgi:hypothetical protein